MELLLRLIWSTAVLVGIGQRSGNSYPVSRSELGGSYHPRKKLPMAAETGLGVITAILVMASGAICEKGFSSPPGISLPFAVGGFFAPGDSGSEGLQTGGERPRPYDGQPSVSEAIVQAESLSPSGSESNLQPEEETPTPAHSAPRPEVSDQTLPSREQRDDTSAVQSASSAAAEVTSPTASPTDRELPPASLGEGKEASSSIPKEPQDSQKEAQGQERDVSPPTPQAPSADSAVRSNQEEPTAPAPLPARAGAGDLRQAPWLKLIVTALVIVLGLGVARFLAIQWRMPEYQTRFAVVLLTFFAGLAIVVMGWPPRRGIDLRGGVILIYEIEDQPVEETTSPDEEVAPRRVDIEKLVQAINRRVNPGGVLEVTIRPLGDTQIEVIIPEADREEVERLKRKISAAGTLEFRILANNRDHQALIEQALNREDRVLRDAEGRVLAWWVPIARGQEGNFAYPEIATRKRKDPRTGYEFTEVLVVKDPFDVTGAYLVHAAPGFDRTGAPAVFFTFNSEGGMRFGGLTGNNLPEPGQVEFTRKLGIILDGYLYSAPAIRDTIFTHGEITGRFTREEVQDLVDVLNAGSLPARLSEQPVSELVIGPTLGRDTVRRGMIAMITSAILVLAFMIWYYWFAGLVACLGLVQTVLLILAVMISIRAAFTLPGFAGLVLTLGMAVDANVLIYERIREELEKGASLRMAIRNGFDRAKSAIVDANLTTLITATVLYVIGRDQIRGFAVTLWLGVVMAMFAMLYCCRVILEVAERQRWISRLKMFKLIGTPSVPFMQRAHIAMAGSAALIILGLIAVVARGRGLLDIDFTGGVSIEVEFVEPQDIGMVRAKLGSPEVGLMDLAISDVRRLDDPTPGRHFLINTSGVRGMDPNAPPSEVFAEVQRRLKQVFGRQLAHYSVTYSILSGQEALSAHSPRGRGLTTGRSLLGLESHPHVPPAYWAVAVANVIQGYSEESVSSETPVRMANAGGSPGEGSPGTLEQPPSQLSEKTASEAEAQPPAAVETAQNVALQGSALDRPSPPSTQTAEIQRSSDSVGNTRVETGGGLPSQEAAVIGESSSTAGPESRFPGTQQPENVAGAVAEKAEESPKTEKPAGAAPRPKVKARLTFQQAVVYETVDTLVAQAIEEEFRAGRIDRIVPYTLSPAEEEADSESASSIWDIELELSPELSKEVLDLIVARVNDIPYFPSMNTVGGAVAAGTRIIGIAAVLSSLVFIVAYIWVRFQRLIYGIAAVVALIHDVLFTLGAIAASAYLANWLGWLLIGEFKISLSVLAAFLTIIGYSLNDTIIVFDRIREVKGRAPRLTAEMVDRSINQTLSRTILTSLTTLLVVVVLYVGGGPAIHAFAFSILVGIIVGTYSSIFIASPLLVWFSRWEEKRLARARATAAKA
jgi:SecD/SecF fusion protein